MMYRNLIRSWGALKFCLLLFVLGSCDHEYEYRYFQSGKVSRNYQTQNVIVVIIDGLRYTEAWGDSIHKFMPRISNDLADIGVINNSFYNKGGTYTSAGHTSITTGIYQEIDNGGAELPENPSIFQYWNQAYGNDPLKSWIITSKDKLAILGNCINPYWTDKFKPPVNSGVDGLGLGSGYREDSLTLKTAIEILKVHHPNLVIINFRDPDYSAHSGIWESYVNGIRKTDEYVFRLWQFIQTNSYYTNTTTMFVTSDHGRHLDSVADGFAGHGDGCDGCRHLGFFACGPDFKNGITLNEPREQIDLPATIARLMGFELPNTKGKVMFELFSRR